MLDCIQQVERNDAGVKKTDALAQTHGVKAAAYKVDISDPGQMKNTIAAVVRDFGRIDFFVAKAGMAISKPILEQQLDQYREKVSANVDGVVFQRQDSGNLMIISSMIAHIVNVPTDQPVYNGTKAFILHFGKSLAREWREFPRVNIVSPGFFDTKMGASPLSVSEAYRMTSLGRQGHTKELRVYNSPLPATLLPIRRGATFLLMVDTCFHEHEFIDCLN
ncbi:hypothetical protein BGW36DRAFT_379553 [Talaromyces proteolyticus]|uniref:Uncharacterized protein n=1 Tax=Talaromyces proteolyticus TaxID=1131652 RepID=A0AAD4KQ50_9EURO|nr:uncharacterized protein BGW36DRAFT_379553 [Talaromyces proteolyticus]KAH8697837.1 hypothetical protein BGW36DRAFT_379553 [Talaromyces proteolyticus]